MRRGAALLAVTLLTLTACSGDDDDSTALDPVTTATAEPSSTTEGDDPTTSTTPREPVGSAVGGYLAQMSAVDAFKQPSATVLGEFLGMPDDIADVPGELAHVAATVQSSTTSFSVGMLHDAASAAEVAADVQSDLVADGWDVTGPLERYGGLHLQGGRDTDGVDDGISDGVGEESVLVDVQAQADGTLVAFYILTLNPEGERAPDPEGTLFAALDEARFDPAMTLRNASLISTMRPFTVTSTFGQRDFDTGVSFTASYEAPLAEAPRLVDELEALCGRDGYECLGEFTSVEPDQGSVDVRLPIGAEGALSAIGVEGIPATSVEFFLSFGLEGL